MVEPRSCPDIQGLLSISCRIPRPETREKISSTCRASVLALCLWLVLSGGLAGLLSAAPAVVVAGGAGDKSLETGLAVESGRHLKNKGASPLFLLLSTGRLERVEPGSPVRIPDEPRPRAWFYDSIAAALQDFHKKHLRLSSILKKKFPDSEPPDTVEGTLVYPVGATLVELPEAFKWHPEPGARVQFELARAAGEAALLRTVVGGGRLDMESFESLLLPGVRYRWVVAARERTDTSYFSLLGANELIALSERLTALDRLEELDPDSGNSYGWLVLKTAVLCRLELYYEARAQILFRMKQKAAERSALSGSNDSRGGSRTAPARTDEDLYDLLRRVRRLQRYGHLLRSR